MYTISGQLLSVVLLGQLLLDNETDDRTKFPTEKNILSACESMYKRSALFCPQADKEQEILLIVAAASSTAGESSNGDCRCWRNGFLTLQ